MKKERRARSVDLGDESDHGPSVSDSSSPYTVRGHHGGGSRRARHKEGAGPGGADERRTQSERRASSRERRPAWGRRINAHVRATWETVLEVRRKVKAFKRSCLGSSSQFDFASCTKCLEEDILPGWSSGMRNGLDSAESTSGKSRKGTARNVVGDYEDFLNLTLRKEIVESVMRSDEYMDLLSIANRARQFESLVLDSQRRLHNCYYDHAKPHLVSLKYALNTSSPSSSPSPNSSGEDGEGSDFKSVDAYDRLCLSHDAACDQKLRDLNGEYKSYRKTLKPFLEFVRNGNSHSALMENCSSYMLEICKLLEKWAGEDDGYPDKLESEMEEKRKSREEHQESLKQLKFNKQEKKEQITRLRKREGKAAERYHEFKTSRERLHDRLGELRERDVMLEERIKSKKDEREKLRDNREQSPQRSQAASERPERLDRLERLERLENLEEMIEKLEREKRAARKQIRRVEQDVKPTSDRAYENKVEMVTHRHQREDHEKAIRQIDEDAASLREKIAHLDEQREKLAHIRELKISPEAYRKSLRQLRRQEVSKADGSHDLTAACQQAAPSLGKQWRKLYFLLPFDPPRDLDKRHRDVLLLDTLASRNDLTEQEVALRSLAKWRTFHRRGGVADLSQALRDIRKRSLAAKIEKAFTSKARGRPVKAAV